MTKDHTYLLQHVKCEDFIIIVYANILYTEIEVFFSVYRCKSMFLTLIGND